MYGPTQSNLALAGSFVGAAGRYWGGAFPVVGREVRHWRRLAREIPDPALRRLALVTQSRERGNLDGAAAFAVLAPRAQRERVVRAVVAFQATYDYIDTLSEQPSDDPVANGHQLHLALLSALAPGAEHPDYYAHNGSGADAGYMRSLIDACRGALEDLPSYQAVAEPARLAARRMAAYQSFNHLPPGEAPRALARWARTETPAGSGLEWWETAAGAASSLGVFALIATAAQPGLSADETTAMIDAYFPWIGALHVLLDSLVDRPEDIDSGQHSLVGHYRSSEEAATRLAAIAARAVDATESLVGGSAHAVILAAMTSFYLCAPPAHASGAQLVTSRVRETMGVLAAPTMAVLSARRAAGRLGWRYNVSRTAPAASSSGSAASL